MFKKIAVIVAMLGIVGGAILTPLLSAHAQGTTATGVTINITDGGVSNSGVWSINMDITYDYAKYGEPQAELFIDEVKNGTNIKTVIPRVVKIIPDPNTTQVNGLTSFTATMQSAAVIRKGYSYSATIKLRIADPQIAPATSNILSFTNNANGEVSNQNSQTGAQTGASAGVSTLPTCSLDPFSFKLAGCLSQLVYWGLFVPTSFIFSLSGQFLDWAMGFTLDSNSYSGTTATFVENGWKITRDIANILFIFILLWTGIGTIIGSHSVDAKKTIGMVILIALLLNFSLFFARVIIDASNILGGVFYNNISVDDTKNVYNPWLNPDTKNISVSIVSKFNPQSLFEQAGSLQLTTQSGISDSEGYSSGPPPFQFGIISLIMTVINCIGIWTFMTVGFLFVGRVAGLWIAMIFAPIAFISYILPTGAGGMLGEMHHSKWWSSLVKQAMVVPIFMFFMYLILKFMQTNFFASTNGKTTPQVILGVLIPLVIIVVLLTKARKIATDMSGEMGGMAVAAGTWVTGMAASVALGGAALAGQRFAGAYAKSQDTEERRDLAAGKVTDKIRQRTEFLGKSDDDIMKMQKFQNLQRDAEKKLKRVQYFSNATFDARQTGLGNLVSAQTGMNMGGIGMFKTENTAGGYEGAVARKAEKDRKFSDKFGVNHDQQVALQDSIDARKKEISDAEDMISDTEGIVKNIKEMLNTAKQPGNGGQATFVDPQTGVSVTKDINGWQSELTMETNRINMEKQRLSKLRKGEEIKWKDSDVGSTNPANGQIITQNDVGKVKTNFAWTQADVTAGRTRADGQLVTDNDIGKVAKTEFLGLDALEKSLANNEKSRARAYLHQKMVQSGYAVHGEKLDQVGNITKMGHIDSTQGPNMRTWRKAIGSAIESGLVTGMTAGLTGAALLGPAGAIGGAIGGGILGFMRENDIFSDPFSRKLDARAAALAGDLDHKIHTFSSMYKAPSSNFMSMFKEVFESKGGGGGHDDHDAGHAGDHH